MQFKSQSNTVVQVRRIIDIFQKSNSKIRPHFILTGPSGAGKSNLVDKLCSTYNLKFLEVNAAAITKEGTSGASLTKILGPIKEYPNTPLVCFVDEFDKLFISGNSNSTLAHETTNGVQNEFLKILESPSTKTYLDYGKYEDISIENVLFIFAGTFNGEPNLTPSRLKEMGMKTEFLGRVTSVFNLPKLTAKELKNIIETSNLLKEYLKIHPNVDADECIKTISDHIDIIYEKNTIGARIVNNLIHQYFITDGNLDASLLNA